MAAKITHVAIVYKGVTYSLPAPNRHYNVISLIVEKTGERMVGENEQGFLDEEGVFLRRAPALIRARKTGQLLKDRELNNNVGMKLYSEDLW